MGVPKFYRWVSERYPCLSQVIQEYQIPDFDNLYLDMNGIIHPCSHPNDDDPHFRKAEEDIFADICHYIEVLFRIIKPKKVFFMAVDGVAPRAKMNQQRGRRFRSAKEAEDNIRKALEKGQVLPKEERFDSNCITPGTPFMTRLHEQLKFFVNNKISTDAAWQGLRIYLSGHETPGEGEHKIMEFIRSEKVHSDYDPNTRHCLYGLDADLIMLGLSSHEPHFSLLREEVKFGKAAKRITKPEKTTFHLLHLSLFREYLDWEFSELKEKLPFPYDLERIIDDWILMGFLVGNDFIPHLPNLHINHDALPYLYKVYIDVMPSLDGFLNDGGKLMLPRFEQYLVALSKFDRDQFEEKFVDMKWFESKKGFTFGNNSEELQNDDSLLTLDNSFAALDLIHEESTAMKRKETKSKANPELEKLAAKFDDNLLDDDEDIFDIEFGVFKRDYYIQKFGFEEITSGVLAELTFQYVQGIQWILFYYFHGVPSWSWFYPFHYAPYMSDVRKFSELAITFELGTPFLPFEQLLAVLPAASRQLLPKPFQNLMIMEQSDIIEYYPLNFKTDLNGKQQEWEAVVLIPFIDERRLLDAMSPLYSRLTEEEMARNKHGPCLLYTYDPSLSFFCPSSLPGKFLDISCCHARCEVLNKDVFHVDVQHMHQGLCEGVKLDVYYPGFPTLYHISHKAELKKANVKVFQMHSKGQSMILQITEPHEEVSSLNIARELLGETCYVGWPHMVEALVMAVCDGNKRLTLEKKSTNSSSKEIVQQVLTELEIKSWKHQVKCTREHHLERRGIELGQTTVMIEACTIRGKRYVCGAKGLVTMEKEWSPMPVCYPYQLTVQDIHVHESHEDDNIHTIEDLFPVGSLCFMLASPYYGASGEVIEIDVKQSRVRVQLQVPTEPDILSVIDQHQAMSLHYLPAYVVAKKLGISPNLLSRITGSFLIEPGSSTDASGGGTKVDIGLNMKFSKQNKEVLGYTRRTEEGEWTYSPTARKTIAEYLKKFPQLFEYLAKMSSNDRCFAKDMDKDGNGSKPLLEVQQWLKTVPALNLEPIKCGSISLDEPVVEAIEKAVQQTKHLNQKAKTVKVRVRPHLLFRPSEHLGAVLPDSEATFELFDRVVNVKLNAAVPFGLKGTIVGIHQGEDSFSVQYEVVFDEPFLGGLPLRCSSNKLYLMRAASLINISYGARCEAKKVEEKSECKSQHPGGRASFSPNLGASPELGKKIKNTKPSADVKLGSPGISDFGHGMSPSNNAHGSPLQFKNSPYLADSKIRQRAPVTQAKGFPQAQIYMNRPTEGANDGIMSIPPQFQKVSLVQTSKPNNGPSEFADMWKELKLKESSPSGHGTSTNSSTNTAPVNKKAYREKEITESDLLIKEGTQALREMLQIGEPQRDDAEKQKDRHQPVLHYKELSLDELFSNQSSSQVTVQQFPQLPSPLPSRNLASVSLLSWCSSFGLPPPYYHYSPAPQGVIATVELANGFKFPGSACRDQGEALESAASVALFQLPQIMPNITSPRQTTMQQQFSPGFFSSPYHPVIRPAFPGFVSLSSSRVQAIHHQSSQPRPSTGNGKLTVSPIKEPLTKQGVSQPLSSSAVPFIPLQVTRRSSSCQQPSPAKPQETLLTESLTSGSQHGEQSVFKETTEKHKNVSSALLSGLSANNSCAMQDSQETCSVPVPGTDKPGTPSRRTPRSSKRLLAPSFFAKRS